MSSSSKKRSILKKHKTLQESLDSKYGVVGGGGEEEQATRSRNRKDRHITLTSVDVQIFCLVSNN
jgi:hypothetical protein